MAASIRELLELQIKTAGEQDLLKLSDSLTKLEIDGGKAETATGKLVSELAKLEKVSGAAAQFEKLSAAVSITSAKLLEAKAAQEKANAALAAADKPTKDLTKAANDAAKEVAKLEATQTKQTATLANQSAALKAAGVDTTKLASEQARLAAESTKAEKSIQAQAATLRANAAAAEASAARWKALGQSLGEARTKANELAGGFAKVGAAAVAAAAAAAAYAGVKFFEGGLDDAGALEQALARIQSAAGLTADELATVQTAIEQTAVAASRDVGEAAIAFEALSREGSTAAEAIGALKPALDFATAANLSAKDAVAALSGALDAFGLSADQTATAADTIAAAALKGGTGIADLTAALAKAGPGARGLGLDLQTTTAALAALAQAGIEGGRAGSAFLKIIDDLADPTSRLSEALTEAGITSRDFGTVLAQLDAKGVGAEKVFNSLGTNSSAALRALAQNGGAALAEIRTSLDNTAGATERAAAAINDTYTVSLANLGRAFEAARVELVKPLLGPLSDELDKLTAAIAEFAQSPAFAELQTALVGAFKAGAEAVTEFLGAVDFAEVTSRITTFVGEAGDSFKTFGDNIAAVVAGVQVTFAAFRIAIDSLKTGIFGLAAAGAKIAELGARFVAFQTDLINSVPAIRLAAKIMGEDLGEAADSLRLKADGLAGVFDEFGNRAVAGANAAAKGMDDFAAAANRAAAPVDILGDSIFKTGTAAGDSIPLIKPLPELIDAVSVASARAAPQVGAVGGQLSIVGSAAAGAADNLKKVGDSSEEAGKKTESGAKQGAAALRDAAGAANEAGDAGQRAGEGVKQAGEEVKKAGEEIGGAGSATEQFVALLDSLNQRFAAISENARLYFVEVQTGMTRAVTSLQEFRTRTLQAAEFVQQKVDDQKAGLDATVSAIDRLVTESERGFGDMGRAIGSTTEDLANLERVANRSTAEFQLLNSADLSRLQAQIDRAGSRLQALKDQAKSARDALDGLADSLQDAIDRRAGNDRAILERQYQEQLQRIRDLAAQGGAEAQAQAAAARALAERNFREELARIEAAAKARAAAEAQAAARSAETNARSDESTGGSRSAGGVQPSSIGPPPVNISIAVQGSVIGSNAAQLSEELARLIAPQLTKLWNRGLPR